MLRIFLRACCTLAGPYSHWIFQKVKVFVRQAPPPTGPNPFFLLSAFFPACIHNLPPPSMRTKRGMDDVAMKIHHQLRQMFRGPQQASL